MEIKPNFSEYSRHELLEAIKHIDKDVYPERYQEVDKLLNNREHLSAAKAAYDESIKSDRYATFWPRFFAATIDGVIFMGVFYIECLLFGIDSDAQPESLQALNGVQLSVYVIFMHGLFGQTIGKMIMNVKILDHATESDIGIKQALRRESVNLIINIIWASMVIFLAASIEATGSITVTFASIVVGFTLLAAIWGIAEFITMLFNNKRRAIHDFIGRTVVVCT